MLFRVRAFKELSRDGPTLNCPENLYSLRVLDGIGQQKLKIKDELLDQFVFCQAIREADGIRIATDQQLSSAGVRYRMKRAGEITGFEHVARPYAFRYMAAKAFNDSRKSSPEHSPTCHTLTSYETSSGCDGRVAKCDVATCQCQHLF